MSTRRVGLDVGGTKCLGVVLDEHGALAEEHQVPTPKGADAIIDALVGLVHRLGPFDSIGVGVPGLVTRDGVLKAAPNLVDITDFRVAELLGSRVGAPVEVDNDATCATVAEWRVGAARGSRDAVMVTLGTGIGGGVVAGGALQRGTNGFAGEIGHMVVHPDGPPCPCGRRGCWERYASGSGLGRLAREAAEAGRLGGVLALVQGDVDAISGEHVQRAAANGDAGAVAVLDDFARWVALGLVNLTNALDPEVFVIGGGLANLGTQLHDPVRRWFGELLYAPSMRPHPRLEIAQLGSTAGGVGAALLPEVH